MTGEVERPRKWEMSPAEIETERAAYDGAIAYMDHELNALLEQLEQRGLADTLVIITSDHGEQHGEHGLFSHGNSLYMQTLHVPLVMTWRGHIPANRTVSQIISLRDIPSTILDLINLPAAPSFGNSLRRYWEPNAQIITADTPILSAVSKGFGEAWYPNSKGDMRSIAMEGIHYIQSGDGGMEAYALAHDPLELNAMPLPADVQRTVSKELSKWFDAAGKESRAAGVKQP